MAPPSYASRLPPAPDEPARGDTDSPSPVSSAARLIARVRAILADKSESRLAQLVAGKVFLVRVASALLALVSQVLLARFMGAYEFGIYIYVWTWVLMIGALSDMGLSSAARRFIPEYTELKAFDHLRGFIAGSRWLAFGIASAIGAVGAVGVWLLQDVINHYTVIPLYLACLTIPIYGLVQTQAGIAQSYDWPNLALMPFYIWRQLAITVAMGAAWLFGAPTDAVTAMIVAVATTWLVTLGQLVMLERRLKRKVEPGPKTYEPKTWLATSLPIFVVEGFYLLLTYVDILMLEQMRSPQDVAVYYAGARLLAIVAFVYFAIAGATTHKFTQYYVAGDKERLATFFKETTRWTFWPSLAICAVILAFGYPLLGLFGPNFGEGYVVMFILAVGMLARAAVGPAERLLNMLGDRKQCASIYALAFAINLALCLVLIPRLGIEGAAISTSTALVVESIMLYVTAKRRLGFHVFIVGSSKRSP
ncbi:flippase [Pseudolabrys taiwanensis]|uniref:Flippase n=1 Tax=Pseudolabrys taiwanensis TaxID=331696 RepID=A0A345ZY04_9HYPH|nr:flippase [Pseudolabrys taiwanensis]AXK81801.1 flippase [Pseudolabrys taiwanensis]